MDYELYQMDPSDFLGHICREKAFVISTEKKDLFKEALPPLAGELGVEVRVDGNFSELFSNS